MTESLDALVLRQVDVGEADRIVSLLTAERGRFDVRVPGVRRSRKRFGGLDLYVRAEVELGVGRGKPRLSGMRLVDDHAGIRSDVVRLALAGHAAELLHQAVFEDQKAEQPFRLACSAFQSLSSGDASPLVAHGWACAFELKLLYVLGNRPTLRSCAACGGPLDPAQLAWSVRAGGVLSGECRKEDPVAPRIAASVVNRLDEALHLPLADQGAIRWSSREQDEAGTALRHFVVEHVGMRDRARRFLDQVLGPVGSALWTPALFLAPLAVAGLVACSPPSGDPTVRVQGYLYDSRTPGEEPESISGSEVQAFADDGRLLGEGTEPFSNYPGWYRVAGLPPETAVHLEFESPGPEWVTTTLSGRTAAADLWVHPGTFHLFPSEEFDSWLASWADHLEPDPDVKASWAQTDEPGVGGIVRGALAEPGEHLGLRLTFVDADGISRAAHYSDEAGLPSEAEGVTEGGGFAAFGLAPGPVEVLVFDADDSTSGRSFVSRVPEDGVLSLFDFEIL